MENEGNINEIESKLSPIVEKLSKLEDLELIKLIEMLADKVGIKIAEEENKEGEGEGEGNENIPGTVEGANPEGELAEEGKQETMSPESVIKGIML